MTDHKFTDDDVIKALECCNTPGSCSECPYYVTNEVEYDDSCVQNLIIDILPLINRQEAEIERLKKIGDDKTSEILRHATAIGELHKQLETAKSEAIKEFAERLKSDLGRIPQYRFTRSQVEWSINTFVKEMTEEIK